MFRYKDIGLVRSQKFYQNYTDVFGTFEKQPGKLNGRYFYKSLNGNFSLEYALCEGDNAWAIKSPIDE